MELLTNVPTVYPHSGEVFIYPPWATFSPKWRDLPMLFLAPETWGPNYDLARLKQLGYTVDRHDHRFFDGPSGGGLIQVLRDSRRWLLRVLFLQEASYRSPVGFPSIGGSPIYAMVPYLSSQHRILRDKPVPRTPSPHVSVEQLPNGVNERYIALGVSEPEQFEDAEFRAGFPSLELTLHRLETCPENSRGTFAKVNDPRLTWIWYSIQCPAHKPSLWIAAVIYLGLRLADVTRNNVRDMMIFTSEYFPDATFPSAQLWTSRKTKGAIKTSDDWR